MSKETTIISKDVAKMLGIAKTTLYRRIKKGAFLPPYKDEFGYFYWDRQELDDFILNGGVSDGNR